MIAQQYLEQHGVTNHDYYNLPDDSPIKNKFPTKPKVLVDVSSFSEKARNRVVHDVGQGTLVNANIVVGEDESRRLSFALDSPEEEAYVPEMEPKDLLVAVAAEPGDEEEPAAKKGRWAALDDEIEQVQYANQRMWEQLGFPLDCYYLYVPQNDFWLGVHEYLGSKLSKDLSETAKNVQRYMNGLKVTLRPICKLLHPLTIPGAARSLYYAILAWTRPVGARFVDLLRHVVDWSIDGQFAMATTPTHGRTLLAANVSHENVLRYEHQGDVESVAKNLVKANADFDLMNAEVSKIGGNTSELVEEMRRQMQECKLAPGKFGKRKGSHHKQGTLDHTCTLMSFSLVGSVLLQIKFEEIFHHFTTVAARHGINLWMMSWPCSYQK